MAIVLVNTVVGFSGGDTGSFTTSPGIDTSGADLLVLVVAYASGTTVTISDSKSNSSWAQAVLETTVANLAIYYAWNATVGTGHTFTVTGTSIVATANVFAYSGSQTSSDPLDKTNHAFAGFGVSTAQPGSVTPATDGQVLVTGLRNGPSTLSFYSVNSSFSTPIGDNSSTFGHDPCQASYLVQGTAGALNPTWTLSSGSGNLESVIATFTAAAGGATTIATPVGVSQFSGKVPEMVVSDQYAAHVNIKNRLAP